MAEERYVWSDREREENAEPVAEHRPLKDAYCVGAMNPNMDDGAEQEG